MLNIGFWVAPQIRAHSGGYISVPRAVVMSPRSTTSDQPNGPKQLGRLGLGVGVVAGDEHGVVTTGELLGIDHEIGVHRVQRLHHPSGGEAALDLLPNESVLETNSDGGIP